MCSRFHFCPFSTSSISFTICQNALPCRCSSPTPSIPRDAYLMLLAVLYRNTRPVLSRKAVVPQVRSYQWHFDRNSAPRNHVLQTRQAWRAQNRGKKTKAAVKLDKLPQGVIPLEPWLLEQDASTSYPTVVQQARTNMRKFENCVLLTRVGGFYELYFEHADEFGPLMNRKVSQKRSNAGNVSMVLPQSLYANMVF